MLRVLAMVTVEAASNQVDFICQYLDEHENDLEANLEIIGNILLRLGTQYMDLDLPESTDVLTSDQVIDLVLEDRKSNGETIPNATALQGLTLLNWLHGE